MKVSQMKLPLKIAGCHSLLASWLALREHEATQPTGHRRLLVDLSGDAYPFVSLQIMIGHSRCISNAWRG